MHTKTHVGVGGGVCPFPHFFHHLETPTWNPSPPLLGLAASSTWGIVTSHACPFLFLQYLVYSSFGLWFPVYLLFSSVSLAFVPLFFSSFFNLSQSYSNSNWHQPTTPLCTSTTIPADGSASFWPVRNGVTKPFFQPVSLLGTLGPVILFSAWSTWWGCEDKTGGEDHWHCPVFTQAFLHLHTHIHTHTHTKYLKGTIIYRLQNV